MAKEKTTSERAPVLTTRPTPVSALASAPPEQTPGVPLICFIRLIATAAAAAAAEVDAEVDAEVEAKAEAEAEAEAETQKRRNADTQIVEFVVREYWA